MGSGGGSGVGDGGGGEVGEGTGEVGVGRFTAGVAVAWGTAVKATVGGAAGIVGPKGVGDGASAGWQALARAPAIASARMNPRELRHSRVLFIGNLTRHRH